MKSEQIKEYVLSQLNNWDIKNFNSDKEKLIKAINRQKPENIENYFIFCYKAHTVRAKTMEIIQIFLLNI